jgi:hypothetical protein
MNTSKREKGLEPRKVLVKIEQGALEPASFHPPLFSRATIGGGGAAGVMLVRARFAHLNTPTRNDAPRKKRRRPKAPPLRREPRWFSFSYSFAP